MNNCFRYLTKGDGSSGPPDVTLAPFDGADTISTALSSDIGALSIVAVSLATINLEAQGAVASLSVTADLSAAVITLKDIGIVPDFSGSTLSATELYLNGGFGTTFTVPNGFSTLVWTGETTTTGLVFDVPPATLTLSCTGTGATPITFAATFADDLPAATALAWDFASNIVESALPYLVTQIANISGGTLNLGGTLIGQQLASLTLDASGSGYSDGTAEATGNNGSSAVITLTTTAGAIDSLTLVSSTQNWGTAEIAANGVITQAGSGNNGTWMSGNGSPSNSVAALQSAGVTVTYTAKP